MSLGFETSEGTRVPFNTVDGVVAVDSHVPTAGAIVWWRLSGTVDYETLEREWLAASLDPKYLPSPCSPTVALRRAVDEIREKRMLVRPMGRGNGFVVVRERVVDDETEELDHDKVAKVTLDLIGRVKVTELKDGDHETTKRIQRTVEEAFQRQLETLDTGDISGWLSHLMPHLDAVSLRDKGGVYFIPHEAVGRVTDVVRILRKVSNHVVNRVPAMRSEEAVEAILDAITQEAQAEAEGLERDLEEMKLGEKAFENRVAHCDDVESKVTRYEELLGRKLDDVREKLEGLRARLTLAVLQNKGKDEV